MPINVCFSQVELLNAFPFFPQAGFIIDAYPKKKKNCLAFPDHTVVAMPALSPTMTSGNIGTWQKKTGDSVSAGDVLVEIETDKAQMDFEYQEEGVLAKILMDSGSKDVAVGSVCSLNNLNFPLLYIIFFV